MTPGAELALPTRREQGLPDSAYDELARIIEEEAERLAEARKAGPT